ncbi:MAG: ABC transporter ATP-binding protein [Armatimonadota bacterium]|nr:ABC transporter ATP-binding protein [Armatimonadota bacterium]MDR7426147.1 ABC transporter ATP-binding protein [Armatimonadota bacterium]MDR7470393.1 ABC transporter ATP-binding protein [Armatimonadota bacterium]MDR7474061.1 ABC transporter ATP-binding protein [Armatimonadota bacterium]
MLETQNLTKSFGGILALDGLSLTVPAGTIVGLIGPNGSGKTTFFNLVTGVYPPDRGLVRFRGRLITGLRPHRIARLGIGRTFQIPAPFVKMTVLDDVAVGAFIHAGTMAAARRAAMEILEFVGLAGKARELVSQVTLEDRKRLELARALATRPELLLLDEVMAGLNPTEVRAAVELIRAIRARGITIVVVEHVMDAILSLCERIVVLNQGRKIAEDVPERIVTDEAVIRAYLGERRRAAH